MGIFYVPIRRLVYSALGMVSIALKSKPLPVFVLCYHSISDDGWYFSVTLENFKKQITHLKNNFEIISLSDLEDYIDGKKKFTRQAVVVTFDDGYKNILSVCELYKDIKVKPSVFVIADTKETNFGELKTKRKFLSNSDIKKLIKDGWEVGSHTLTHPDMYKLNQFNLEKEVVQSKKMIENDLGIEIKYLAYPKGRYTNKVVNMAKKAKYKMALTMDDDLIDINTNKLKIPRIGVDNTHSLFEFKYLYYPLLSKLRKLLK